MFPWVLAAGKKHGWGNFLFADGTEFQGSWQFDKPHGVGTLVQVRCDTPPGCALVVRAGAQTNARVCTLLWLVTLGACLLDGRRMAPGWRVCSVWATWNGLRLRPPRTARFSRAASVTGCGTGMASYVGLLGTPTTEIFRFARTHAPV